MKCTAGEVKTRSEIAEEKRLAAIEAAKVQTLKQYFDSVYLPAKKRECAAKTIESYYNAHRFHIDPVIGMLKMPEITPAELQKVLYKAIDSGLSEATVSGVYKTLLQIFKMAYQTDFLDRNPMEKVVKPKMSKDATKEQDRGVKALSAEELAAVLKALDDEPLKWRCYINLLADTGARRGELTALTWRNVDFTNCTITIDSTACYLPDRGVFVSAPKTKNAYRTISVDPALMSMLKQYRMETLANGFSQYVFPMDENGQLPMHPDSPNRWLQRFSKKNGFTNRHPHLLRHSFASIAIENGADAAAVSENLGHANKSITLNLYCHANQKSMKAASDLVRKALKNA
ncbi:MAG: site-specific integrase [Clostridia bacterium]|nr:site-specific integrase [Clostridia bacterium]